MNSELKSLLLKAPESQLDNSIKELIKQWHNPPSSLQVLEVLDKTVYGSLGSDFTVKVLDMILNERLTSENTTLEQIVPHATWRIR